MTCSTWLNRRIASRFTVNVHDRKDCTVGGDTVGERRVVLTNQQVMSICEFDCKNAVISVGGKLWKRELGCPMGGYLSAFYAILGFGCIESRCLMPLFLCLCIPGGLRRYLDGILAILGVTELVTVLHIQEFLDTLASEDVYPPPLQLNLEPEGDQDFLEARVFKSWGTVKVKLLNKVVEDKLAGREGYRQRLAATPYMSQRELNEQVRGITIRAVQTCSDWSLLRESLNELRYECLAHAKTERPFHQAVTYLRAKYATNEKVMKAIRKI